MPKQRRGSLIFAQSGEIVGHTREGRPVVRNPDGSVSTERTITIEVDGGYMNIPTMYGGKQVSPEEAIRRIRKSKGVDPETKRKLRVHPSIEEAEREAKKRSEQLGEELKDVLRRLSKSK